MTRILAVGAGGSDNPALIYDALEEANSIYGPIICLIHANHPHVLAWYQSISKVHRISHMPIIENPWDGVAAGERWRARLFDEGQPDYALVFDYLDGEKTRPPKKKLEKIVFMAQRRGIQVLAYSTDKKP